MAQPLPASLLFLPAEISNRIFELSYVKRDENGDKIPIRITSLVIGQGVFFRPLLVNKALANRIRPIIFGQNIFILSQYQEIVNGSGAMDARWMTRPYSGGRGVRHAALDAVTVSQGKFEIAKFGHHSRTGPIDSTSDPSHFGILLPPFAWRTLMKHLRIVIEAPPAYEKGGYWSPHIQWLESLTRLSELGFKDLELLQVHLPTFSDLTGSYQNVAAHIEEFKIFARNAIDAIEPKPAKVVEVHFYEGKE